MVVHNYRRYSKYIRPISILLDICVITFFAAYFLKNLNLNCLHFLIYQAIVWIIIAFIIRFYEVFRFTQPVEVIGKLIKQFAVFALVIIAYFPFRRTAVFSPRALGTSLLLSFLLIIIFKYLFFYYLKKYRLVTKNNFRNAIIIGYSQEAIKLREVFESRKDFGYRFKGYFSDKIDNENIVGTVKQVKDFVLENKIDEIYCSLNEISDRKLKDLVDFADENKLTIKFIPDTKEIFSKNLKIDYYELFPVLSLQKTQLHDPTIKAIKRVFDIVFSVIVILCVLSWLIPLIAILIKIESKGPVFFVQGRPGLDENEFFCYKFRSMRLNYTPEKEASKNDPRVTKIGKFIRKTSIDELPQFLNVLMGDMSVVGPRPHLWTQNKSYANKVKQYMNRHYVKPGITGLAQVKGFRGEIETDEDMISRIEWDVFYIENWSIFLDIKIILQTVINIFKGEDKAY